MTKPNFEAILRKELNGEEDSFLLKLRIGLTWDKEHFSRFIAAMEEGAKAYAASEELPRWLANGFWYASTFIPEWTAHPHFPKEHESDYYLTALRRLHETVHWFFFGEPPNT